VKKPKKLIKKSIKKSIKNDLTKIWQNQKNPAGFSGVSKLQKASKSTRDETTKFLRSQMAYTLHKPIRKRFPTRSYKTSGINDLWQMDLMEMIPYAKINKGFKYILNCIDVFSRFARSVPLKTKSAADVSEALKVLFKSAKPRHLQTDEGKEFYNSQVKSILVKLKINHYSVVSQFKASHVERFNRTLRERLNKYFTQVGNKTWITVLQDIIHSYNNSIHRVIKMKPSKVNKNNEADLWELQNKTKLGKNIKTHKVGDTVRVSKINNSPFIKNFNSNWSDEVFKISAINNKDVPVMYEIKDNKNEKIMGRFYHEELQVIENNSYRIEKILKTKGVGKNKQHYVKWVGYKEPSWINDSAINIGSKRKEIKT